MSYHLLLKTGESELRAWNNLALDRQAQISVHCEITRGRKKPNKDKSAPFEYNIDRVFQAIKSDFTNSKICVVDVTREPSLKSNDIEKLGKSDNGYELWVDCVAKLHSENAKVRPTLLINPKDTDDFEQYKHDLFSQFDAFSAVYDTICYRASVLYDEEFVSDISMLSDRINEYVNNGGDFQILLDFEFIQPSSAALYASYVAPIIREISEFVPKARIVSLGTSFPKNVTDLGDEDRDEFRLEEYHLHREINRIQNSYVEYGDYGSINPVRNDISPPVGIHLRARIDFPTVNNTIFYRRVAPKIDKERSTLLSPRVSMYKDAAKLVVSDSQFSEVKNSWGYKKIVEAATLSPAGKSPNFWISVRMEIHICRRLDGIVQRN